MRRHLLSRAALVLGFVSFLALPAQAADRWVLVASDHFDVVGNTADANLRRVAQTMEHFHGVVVESILKTAAQHGGRATVLVFKDQFSFEQFTPRVAGRGMINGFFVFSDTREILALNAENLGSALRTVLNGHSRAVATNISGELPNWLSSGLGRVYESFEERDGGKGAMIGRPDANLVGILKGATLIPLTRLVALTSESPGMVPGSAQRSLYEAECWALVHYLSFGPRRPQFQAYMASLHGGVAPEQAFVEAFGDGPALESELADYTRKFLFPAMQIVFDEKQTPSLPARGTVLSEADAEGFLSAFMSYTGQGPQARTRLEKVLATAPKSARALAALAEIDVADNRKVQAIARLEEAVAVAPDDQQIQSTLGHVRALWVSEAGEAATAADVQAARAALTRAVALQPNDVVATAELGWMYLFAPADPARAEASLLRAVALNRGKDQYLLWLADAFIRQRKYDEGRKLLGPLMARGSSPDIRNAARTILGEMARLQRQDTAAPR
ncbi:MAG: tetratricopeptide repeat protein [Vicinamibacterales bacterium]